MDSLPSRAAAASSRENPQQLNPPGQQESPDEQHLSENPDLLAEVESDAPPANAYPSHTRLGESTVINTAPFILTINTNDQLTATSAATAERRYLAANVTCRQCGNEGHPASSCTSQLEPACEQTFALERLLRCGLCRAFHLYGKVCRCSQIILQGTSVSTPIVLMGGNTELNRAPGSRERNRQGELRGLNENENENAGSDVVEDRSSLIAAAAAQYGLNLH